MTRRTFCHTAAAGVAATVSLGAGSSGALGSMGPVQAPGAVIGDTRLVASRDFARRAAASGAAESAYRDDPARRWLETLSGLSRARPMAIAGLTTPGALFFLERWAWDLRMRVMTRMEHVALAGGGWRHFAAGTPVLLPEGGNFGMEGADYLLSGAAGWADRTHAAPPGIVGDSEFLVSWVIAPRTVAVS